MKHGSRIKLVTAVVLAVVFGSGMLVGYAAEGGVRAEAATVEPGDTTPVTADGQHVRRAPVYEQLHPTDAQNARIDSILEAHRGQMNELHADFRSAREAYQANYDAIIRDTREAIAEVFPPEEATRYRQLLAEFDRAREQERAGKDDRK
jgi:Spy/CpxP family protein refolding chaperone